MPAIDDYDVNARVIDHTAVPPCIESGNSTGSDDCKNIEPTAGNCFSSSGCMLRWVNVLLSLVTGVLMMCMPYINQAEFYPYDHFKVSDKYELCFNFLSIGINYPYK